MGSQDITPVLLLQCVTTVDGVSCDGRPDDTYSRFPSSVGPTSFDMRLYERFFYFTVLIFDISATPPLIYKMFRVEETPDATPIEITGSDALQFLFVQPEYSKLIITGN